MLALSCDLGGDVDHRGRYAFLPGQGPASTAPLPLDELLIVESDASAGHTRFYLFRGALGKAGIGLDDLQKLALGFGRFDMSFTEALAETGESERGGAAGEPSAQAETVTVELGSASVELRAISAAELGATGAARFTRTLEGASFDVRAYFGVHPGAGALERILLDELEHVPALAPLELRAELAGSTLRVHYGEPRGLDYLELGLLQSVVRREDGARLDAGVVTRTFAGTDYAPTFELVTNVFEQGCWSLDAPLIVRATQSAQHYSSLAGGDHAVLERRVDELELAPSAWNEAIAEARAADYCSALEAPAPSEDATEPPAPPEDGD